MKTAFCTNVFDDSKMPKALEFLDSLGYDGVEFWDQYLQNADIDQLKKTLEETSLSVAQLCPYFNFTGSKKNLDETFEIVDRYVDLARQLDSKLIRVFTGDVSSSEATDAIWEQAVEGLRRLHFY
jgi:sugar phosphate isomerase/epimerase